jgi:hypothetical protein
MALSRRKKKSAVPAGSRSTAPRGGVGVPQRSSRQLAGNRKPNELSSSGDSSEPANRRPAPSEGSAPLPASASTVTGELAASCSWQLGPPEGGATYAAVLAGPVAPFQPSGSLKPIAMDSELSESAVSPETVNMRMSSDMSGPLSDMPDGTTIRAHEGNTCLPAGERPNQTPIFISGVRDTRASLTWWSAPNLPPPHPSMCGADPSAPHVHLIPPHRGSQPAGCLEHRYFLCGRIWQHALGGPYGVKLCASPAGTRAECAPGSLNWSIFSACTV